MRVTLVEDWPVKELRFKVSLAEGNVQTDAILFICIQIDACPIFTVVRKYAVAGSQREQLIEEFMGSWL